MRWSWAPCDAKPCFKYAGDAHRLGWDDLGSLALADIVGLQCIVGSGSLHEDWDHVSCIMIKIIDGQNKDRWESWWEFYILNNMDIVVKSGTIFGFW